MQVIDLYLYISSYALREHPSILYLFIYFSLDASSFCLFPNLINFCFSNILVPFIFRTYFHVFFERFLAFLYKVGNTKPHPTTGKESVASFFFFVQEFTAYNYK